MAPERIKDLHPSPPFHRPTPSVCCPYLEHHVAVGALAALNMSLLTFSGYRGLLSGRSAVDCSRCSAVGSSASGYYMLLNASAAAGRTSTQRYSIAGDTRSTAEQQLQPTADPPLSSTLYHRLLVISSILHQTALLLQACLVTYCPK